MWNDFKAFVLRGNILDMAVGVIIGGAFGKIVSSFVADILMPPIGLITGGVDFKDKVVVLKPAVLEAGVEKVPAVLWNYGLFLQNVVDFLVIATAIFIFLRLLMRVLPKPEPAPAAPATKECPECLMAVPSAAKRCGHCASPIA